MNTCAQKWCRKLCAFLFDVTWAFGKMWTLSTEYLVKISTVPKCRPKVVCIVCFDPGCFSAVYLYVAVINRNMQAASMQKGDCNDTLIMNNLFAL